MISGASFLVSDFCCLIECVFFSGIGRKKLPGMLCNGENYVYLYKNLALGVYGVLMIV